MEYINHKDFNDKLEAIVEANDYLDSIERDKVNGVDISEEGTHVEIYALEDGSQDPEPSDVIWNSDDSYHSKSNLQKGD